MSGTDGPAPRPQDDLGPAEASDPPAPSPGWAEDAAGLVGTVLAGRYRIQRLLGVGAMGAVYLGEHLRIGRRDAIKVLRPALARDPEAVARFTRGARNGSLIQHPHVCTVYDFGDTEEGLQFLAMEFVEGETLSELLRREGALAPERAARLARHVAAGLQAAHDLGVVHRDLKPDNVMVTRAPDSSEIAKVVDFDIAKGSSDAEGPGVTRHGFVIGTPEYMSPEQLAGEGLDGRSDVYSLGLILFRMLTGRLPFDADSTQDLMIQRLTKEPLKLAAVAPGHRFPAGLQEVLDRALARRARERHAGAGAFAAALAAVVPETPGPRADTGEAPGGAERPEGSRPEEGVEEVPGTVVTEDGRPPWWQGRERILAGAGGGVVLLLLGLLAIRAMGGTAPAEVRVLPPEVELRVDESRDLAASVLDEAGRTLEGRSIVWASSEPGVAGVDDAGRVRAIAPGQALVTASVGGLSGVSRIHVRSPLVLRMEPAQVDFVARQGAAAPAARSVAVAVDGDGEAVGLEVDVTYPPQEPGGWLGAELDRTSAPATLTLRPSTGGLAARTYGGTVRVRSSDAGAAAEMRVVLEVRAGGDPEPSIRIPVAQAGAVANRLFLRWDPGLPSAQRSGIRDSAAAVWGLGAGADATARARAAHVVASFHSMAAAGSPTAHREACVWARRAVALEPGNAGHRYLAENMPGGRCP